MDYAGPLELAVLDHRGLVRVRERLQTGKTLAKNLLDLIDTQGGAALAVVAPGLDEDAMYAFEGSAVPQLPRSQAVRNDRGAVSLEVVDTTARLVRVLQSRITGTDRLLIGEDWMAAPTDAWLADSCVAPWLLGDEVYFAASGSAPERVDAVVQNGDGAWPGIMVAVCSAQIEGEAPWQEPWALGGQDIQSFAASTTEIWVGAYDGESYLLWTPDAEVARFYQNEFAQP